MSAGEALGGWHEVYPDHQLRYTHHECLADEPTLVGSHGSAEHRRWTLTGPKEMAGVSLLPTCINAAMSLASGNYRDAAAALEFLHWLRLGGQ